MLDFTYIDNLKIITCQQDYYRLLKLLDCLMGLFFLFAGYLKRMVHIIQADIIQNFI